MNRVLHPAVLVLAASLASGVVHAQARGPAAEEIQQHGQDILSGREKRAAAAVQSRERAMEAARKEREESADPVLRASRLAELDTWFRRIPGRFRIYGHIQKPAGPEGSGVLSDKVTGVADCTGIGAGVGVQCILTATWRTLEPGVGSPGAPPPESEMLRTMSPGVLVLSLNLDPPGIRAQFVDAEGLAHIWVGKLAGSTARANRVNRILGGRPLRTLLVSADPDSEVVTFEIRSGSITLTISMHRDPEARAEKRIKTLREW